jgi:ankyrin repeat protein
MCAAEKGHTATVELLVKQGADLNVQAKDGKTALMCAAENSYTATVELLVKKGAELNVQAKDGTTALMLALSHKDVATVALLLEKGADISNDMLIQLEEKAQQVRPLLSDEKTLEYLNAALERKDVQAANVLLKRISNINLDDSKSGAQSFLFRVAAYAQPSMLKLLVEKSSRWDFLTLVEGDNIDRQDHDGKTALHHAIEHGNIEMINALINEHHASIRIPDKTGQTALALAQHLGKEEIVAILSTKSETLIEKVKTLFLSRSTGQNEKSKALDSPSNKKKL